MKTSCLRRRSLKILPLALFLFACTSNGQTAVTRASRSATDAQVAQLMAKMTPEEKTLQLLSFCPNGVPRLGIPSLQAGEGLHGALSNGATCYPQAIALGATFDPESIERMGVYIGKEARAVGLHQLFAPMLGLARDPRWGRVEESYGEDPYLAAQMGVAYVTGVQGKGAERFGPDKCICTLKHFVADGEPWAGHNGESIDTSERVLREVYLQPFEAAVKLAHAGAIMPAHHQVNGVPCHANTWLLDKVLRKEWGFDGFLTSDMGDVPKLDWGHHYGRNGVRDPFILALTTGVDMELVGDGYKRMPQLVQEGKITQDVVDRAVARVLAAKLQLRGLGSGNGASNETTDAILNHKGKDDLWAKLVAEGRFSTPEANRVVNAKDILTDPTHDALALKLAQEAIVLLKNDNNLLPLNKANLKNMLVVGPLAIQQNTGGYSSSGSKPYINVVDGLKAELGDQVDVAYEQGCNLDDASDAMLGSAVAHAGNADVIIAVVGHSQNQVRENLDRDNLDLIGGQERLVETMKATGKPVIVVLENGAPLSISWIHDNIPAIVESWYGGQNAGKAIAQVLLGTINPGGKMPVTIPKNVGQIPCYYNHLAITGPPDYYQSPWKDLYCFGHGLSYTTFKYGGFKISPQQISRDQTATISVTVENSGPRVGDEVVQLYLHQDYTSVERPVEQLEGFKRITLRPGEQRTVSFQVGFEQLKFWKDGRWVVEPGAIDVMVGSSSQDIRQKAQLHLANGTDPSPPHGS
jgi:beta-glucosidase